MYIVKIDYKSRISKELLNLILTRIVADAEGEDEAAILTDTSKTAVDMITGYACKLYDITPEFSKTGTARNYQILNWAINIALYLIYQRIEDYDVPAKVVKNWDDTTEDLQKLSVGKFQINLPPAPSADGGNGNNEGTGTGLRRIGSATPRTHKM